MKNLLIIVYADGTGYTSSNYYYSKEEVTEEMIECANWDIKSKDDECWYLNRGHEILLKIDDSQDIPNYWMNLEYTLERYRNIQLKKKEERLKLYKKLKEEFE